MADKKEKAECFKKTYTTPQGEAAYPHLAEPQTKFNEAGVYDVTLYFDAEAGGKLLEMLTPAYEQACKEAREIYEQQKPQYKKDNPEIKFEQFYREEVDDDGFGTGRIFVKFKRQATVKTKDRKVIEFSVAVFDRHNQAMPKELVAKASSGSIMRAAFKANPYFVAAGAKAGISLQLEAVQIVELKEWAGTKSADSYGFQSFEDEDDAFLSESAGDNGSTF